MPVVSTENNGVAILDRTRTDASSPRTRITVKAATPALFAGTMFVSASLLFALQPMIAKMLLPRLGGAAAVWNTCLVFFQGALLAGYLYAHLTTRWLRPKQQAALHLILLAIALVFLPVRLSENWEASLDWPVGAVLGLLLTAVGVPFVIVSSSAPLLQRWFALTDDAQAANPYPLYAASNAGSLIALLAYPFVLEPYLDVSAQGVLWAVVYACLIVMEFGCIAVMWRAKDRTAAETTSADEAHHAASGAPDGWARLRWVVLAFVPSSLLAGVTHYLTTDIAAMPLLWVGPLALYLLTFILAFAPLSDRVHRAALYALPVALIVQALTMWSGSLQFAVVLPVQLVAFTATALAYHSELARRRPGAASLTEFYLWIAVGGVLGSLFNGLLAPLLFVQIVEFPLMLVLALACMPTLVTDSQRGRILSRAAGAGLALGLAWIFWNIHSPANEVLVIHRQRSYFSTLRVQRGIAGKTHSLMHGRINHGAQLVSSDPRLRRFPLCYFFPTGPVGQAFSANTEERRRQPIGVIGLGIGTLSAYANPGQEMTYYEIDPAVVEIARNPRFFTFLKDSEERGVNVRVVLGDARRSIEREPDAHFGMLVLDAFSGDAIPVHLLTQEAIELYMRKLADRGWLVVHISNQYFDLEPMLARQVEAGKLAGLVQHDRDMSPEEFKRGKMSSSWAILARTADDLDPLRRDPRWKRLRPPPDAPLWTDRYSNLLGVLR